MAKLLLRHPTSTTTARHARVHSMRSRKRVRLRVDERLTVPCPVSNDSIEEARPTVPAPPPTHQTIMPSSIPRRSGAVAERNDGLEPPAMFLLGLIDGYTPLEEVIAASGLVERVALRFLADLIARGLVSIG